MEFETINDWKTTIDKNYAFTFTGDRVTIAQKKLLSEQYQTITVPIELLKVIIEGKN